MSTGDAAVQDVRPRTGTTFAGFCQVVTAVVGAGILALPSAFAALGWIAGILLLLAFAIITYAATLLLIDCCETDGVRHPTYYYAVKAAFPKSRWPRVGLQIVQQTNLVLTGELMVTLQYGVHIYTINTQAWDTQSPPARRYKRWWWCLRQRVLILSSCRRGLGCLCFLLSRC